MSSIFAKPTTEATRKRRFAVAVVSVGLTLASVSAVSARTYQDDPNVAAAVDVIEFTAPALRNYAGRDGYCEGNLGSALLGGFATQECSGARRIVEC